MKKESKTFIFGNEAEWIVCGDGLRRQIMGYNDDVMAVKVAFDKGAIGAIHTHPHTQSAFIVSGTYRATVGDRTEVVSAGDGYYVAPNLSHGLVCLEAGVLIDIFSPMRDDFVE